MVVTNSNAVRRRTGSGRRSSFDTVVSNGSSHYDMATIVTRVNEIGMLIYVLWRCLYMYAYMYIFRNKIAGGYV